MSFIRQYIAPLVAVLMFLFALFVVSARTFLPSGLSEPAALEDVNFNLKASETVSPNLTTIDVN